MTLGASPAVDGYYSSTQTPLTAVSPSKSTEKPEEAPEEATLMSWMSWTVELANHLTRWWGQRDKDERTAFKALEDKKWNDRKKETVRQTNAHDGVAKHEMERIKQDRLQRGAEISAQTKENEDIIAHRKEEWMQHGHDLTVAHGTEQAAKNKASVAESLGYKADLGRTGKRERQQHAREITTERTRSLTERQAHVHKLMKDKIGKVAEGQRYMLDGRTAAVKEVQSNEEEWRRLQKKESDAFQTRAHDNHASIDHTVENMRAMRKELIARHHDKVLDERRVKEEHAHQLVEKHTNAYHAKRLLRDAVFSARFIAPDKTRIMREFKAATMRERSPEQTALELGLLANMPARPPSPYRMKGSVNENHTHLFFKPPTGFDASDDVSLNAQTPSPERTAALARPVRPRAKFGHTLSPEGSPARGGPNLGGGGALGYAPSRAMQTAELYDV